MNLINLLARVDFINDFRKGYGFMPLIWRRVVTRFLFGFESVEVDGYGLLRNGVSGPSRLGVE